MDGTFEIDFPRESFTVTFSFSDSEHQPTFKAIKNDHVGNQNNYGVKILSGPAVNKSEASVVFEIVSLRSK